MSILTFSSSLMPVRPTIVNNILLQMVIELADVTIVETHLTSLVLHRIDIVSKCTSRPLGSERVQRLHTCALETTDNEIE
jgi:carbamoylphosphate synthase large subunit